MLRWTRQLLSSRVVTQGDVVSAYSVLGLRPGATVADVKKRYLQLARTHHPDVNDGDETKMKRVNVAYELVQQYGQTVSVSGDSSEGAEHGVGKSKADKAWARRRARALHVARQQGDYDPAWSQRSEFDWAATMRVTQQQADDKRFDTGVRDAYFSVEDDTNLFLMVRSGSTVPQMARTLGKEERWVERRLSHPQFKRRCHAVLRDERANKHATEQRSAESDGATRDTSNDAQGLHRNDPRGEWTGWDADNAKHTEWTNPKRFTTVKTEEDAERLRRRDYEQRFGVGEGLNDHDMRRELFDDVWGKALNSTGSRASSSSRHYVGGGGDVVRSYRNYVSSRGEEIFGDGGCAVPLRGKHEPRRRPPYRAPSGHSRRGQHNAAGNPTTPLRNPYAPRAAARHRY